MRRWSFFAYGVFGHLLFLATYVYMAGFVGGLFVPKTLDSPPAGGLYAAAVDLALIGLFALQHSIMARPWFKENWIRLVPQPIERSTYVLFSCAVTAFLMWQWRSLDAVVWEVEQPAARAILWGLFAAGWMAVPAVTLLLNHFELIGIRQVWLYLRGRPYTPLPFRTPLAYRRVRHPLYLGWALAFWATPTMTLGHLLFAAAMTLYMVGAAFIEERDLVRHFGSVYREYQRRVPMFVPRLGRVDRTGPELRETSAAAYPETVTR